MVMREAEIGLRQDTFLPITTVDHKISTQGYLNMLTLGVC